MNRELKFRAWNGHQMVEDVTVGKFGNFYVNPGNNGDGLDPYDMASLTRFTTKYHENTPIMQFTGLRDRNGKDIYEGDIVQRYEHNDITHRHEPAKVWADDRYHADIKVVKFMYGSFVIWSDLIKDYRCFANLARPGESLEIIGNVFENHDFIEQIKKRVI